MAFVFVFENAATSTLIQSPDRVMSITPLESHLKGTLYGLAVGDALGAPYEFKPRGSYVVSGLMEPSYNFTREDGSPMEAGTWTDDTR